MTAVDAEQQDHSTPANVIIASLALLAQVIQISVVEVRGELASLAKVFEWQFETLRLVVHLSVFRFRNA
jgi:hypothetical protein